MGDVSLACDNQFTLGRRCLGELVGPDTISKYQETRTQLSVVYVQVRGSLLPLFWS